MNDYKLINSLFEDGSESALLKLKMIVNFEEFRPTYTVSEHGRVIDFDNNIEQIDDSNIKPFLEFCGKKLVEEWIKDIDQNLLTGNNGIKGDIIKKSLSRMKIDYSHLEQSIEKTIARTKKQHSKLFKFDDDFDEFLKDCL